MTDDQNQTRATLDPAGCKMMRCTDLRDHMCHYDGSDCKYRTSIDQLSALLARNTELVEALKIAERYVSALKNTARGSTTKGGVMHGYDSDNSFHFIDQIADDCFLLYGQTEYERNEDLLQIQAVLAKHEQETV